MGVEGKGTCGCVGKGHMWVWRGRAHMGVEGKGTCEWRERAHVGVEGKGTCEWRERTCWVQTCLVHTFRGVSS